MSNGLFSCSPEGTTCASDRYSSVNQIYFVVDFVCVLVIMFLRTLHNVLFLFPHAGWVLSLRAALKKGLRGV